jgi:hypothetical protein
MIEGLPLTHLQLVQFLNALAGDGGCQFKGANWRCGGPEFTYARKILTSMRIPQADQEKVLDICKENGGHCDCEILMNAARFLLGEDTPW